MLTRYTDDQNKGHNAVNPGCQSSAKWVGFVQSVCACLYVRVHLCVNSELGVFAQVWLFWVS